MIDGVIHIVCDDKMRCTGGSVPHWAVAVLLSNGHTGWHRIDGGKRVTLKASERKICKQCKDAATEFWTKQGA